MILAFFLLAGGNSKNKIRGFRFSWRQQVTRKTQRVFGQDRYAERQTHRQTDRARNNVNRITLVAGNQVAWRAEVGHCLHTGNSWPQFWWQFSPPFVFGCTILPVPGSSIGMFEASRWHVGLQQLTRRVRIPNLHT